MVGGILVTNRDDIAERIAFLQNAAGGVPGPMDCWLAVRGIKTLPLRMRQHDANGRLVAEWVTRHPRVKKTYYPGLESHPQHELARRQMSGFGGMVAFETGDVEYAKRIVERVRIFKLAESLGGVESLIGHPASQTHASVPPELRRELGLSDSLVRLSCGIEDVDDLIGDLQGSDEVGSRFLVWCWMRERLVHTLIRSLEATHRPRSTGALSTGTWHQAPHPEPGTKHSANRLDLKQAPGSSRTGRST
jgi:cystathionine beta-lyase/cystathionine gamma-synthase